MPGAPETERPATGHVSQEQGSCSPAWGAWVPLVWPATLPGQAPHRGPLPSMPGHGLAVSRWSCGHPPPPPHSRWEEWCPSHTLVDLGCLHHPSRAKRSSPRPQGATYWPTVASASPSSTSPHPQLVAQNTLPSENGVFFATSRNKESQSKVPPALQGTQEGEQHLSPVPVGKEGHWPQEVKGT